jgi:hypothetical protein
MGLQNNTIYEGCIMSRKKGSKLREIIKEATQELKQDEPDDPRITDDDEAEDMFFLRPRSQKEKDQVVIDQLLSPIAGKNGYFIKLKKEIKPNEFMLMKVIENEWRRWADVETEVQNIVKENTKYAPQKWGTGAYRVEIACKGGLRGKTYEPIDIYVNAEEELLPPSNTQTPAQTQPQNPPVDPSVAVASQIETLSNLVGMLKSVFPQSPDPSQIQTQIAQAFQQGMQMKMSESNNMTSLIVGMMTAMMTAMKDMIVAKVGEPARQQNPEETLAKMLGVMRDMGLMQSPKSEKTAIDFAKELQALGVELFKKDDPLEQVNKLKQLASIAADFMGMSGTTERPSVLEKIVDVLGPSIPGLIKDVKETVQNAVTAQALASQNLEKVKTLPKPTTPATTPAENMNGTAGAAANAQVKAFFDQLYESIRTNNRMFYPMIYASLMQDANGQALVRDIVNGMRGAADVMELIVKYGDQRFQDKDFIDKQMIGYVNGFILWIQNMKQPEPVNNTFDVICEKCGSMFEFASKQEFDAEQDKTCGVEKDGVKCTGILTPAVANMAGRA